ncbi:MAG TPA: RNA-binding protein [Candidatus Babeliales bacterium]|nr:RNA-binding protein [Candidatus Babeliales bacterium]
MNIYLGNLSYSATENSIKDLFEGYGAVTTAKIVTDKFTGSSRGFGFVEMPNDDEAQRAIAELNGKEFEGRKIVVNESRPRETTGRDNRAPRREGGYNNNRDGGRDGGRNSRY